jgi:hypothetical protein
VIKFVSDLLYLGGWFSPGTSVSYAEYVGLEMGLYPSIYDRYVTQTSSGLYPSIYDRYVTQTSSRRNVI